MCGIRTNQAAQLIPSIAKVEVIDNRAMLEQCPKFCAVLSGLAQFPF
jgi:hypothetical protein